MTQELTKYTPPQIDDIKDVVFEVNNYVNNRKYKKEAEKLSKGYEKTINSPHHDITSFKRMRLRLQKKLEERKKNLK